MSLSEAMQHLCNSLACVSYRGDQHTHVLIKETDSRASLKKVTLLAPNGDWFAFEPDKGRGKQAKMSELLATGKAFDHHRACDCVVLVFKDNKLHVLYIDLKSSNPIGYAGQFKSVRQFVRYLLGLMKEFHGADFSEMKESYLIFHGGKKPLLDKKTTVPLKTQKVGKTSPDKAFKQDVPNGAQLYLKALLG